MLYRRKRNPDLEPILREKVSTLRCPYCFDSINLNEDAETIAFCPKHQTPHHIDCKCPYCGPHKMGRYAVTDVEDEEEPVFWEVINSRDNSSISDPIFHSREEAQDWIGWLSVEEVDTGEVDVAVFDESGDIVEEGFNSQEDAEDWIKWKASSMPAAETWITTSDPVMRFQVIGADGEPIDNNIWWSEDEAEEWIADMVAAAAD